MGDIGAKSGEEVVRKKRKIRKPSRHTFNFKIVGDGETRIHSVKAKVTRASTPVTLTLKPEDVERSIKLGGVANTQTCSMAVCAKRQAERFPHPVDGYIDWQYSTAYVVSKTKDGLPSECFAYRHNDSIAKLNDSKGGQRKLLAELKANGPREIKLLPIRYRPREEGRPRGKNDGSRAKRPTTLSVKGAKLRFAFSQLGGVPA
jgi:hypothetical protein